ncbi:MAG: CHRD domain-containing protein [Bauldia sp.]|nr:CHRD domain-containing protein [Bauldia sp.]
MRQTIARAGAAGLAVALVAGVSFLAFAQEEEEAFVTADSANFIAELSGANESPAVESDGTGTAYIAYNADTGSLIWTVTYSGLSGPVVGGHFHGPAGAGENAGVVLSLGLFEGMAPDPEDLTSPINGSATITAEQAAQLQAGQWYVNLHTEANPGGEIRGQVVAN